MKLKDLKREDKAKIISIEGDLVFKKKILDMGLTKGTVIQVIKTAPLGDPVDIKVRGYQLSIRKRDGERIEVDING